MSRIKFYQIAVIALLLTNLILLAFLLKGNKGGGKNLRPKDIIVEKLGFTKEQTTSYEMLIKEHQISIAQSHKEVRALKNNLYDLLPKAEQDSLIIDSLQTKLSKVKTSIERTHFQHFLDIKSICTPEQLPAFETLSKEMAKLFSPRRNARNRKK